jgi:hypothetical protein
MTIKEAVIAFCSVTVNPSTVDLEIINSGLFGTDAYSQSLENEVAKIACKVLSAVLPLKSFREGELTINYDSEGIKNRLFSLSNQYGFTDFEVSQTPTISSPNVW